MSPLRAQRARATGWRVAPAAALATLVAALPLLAGCDAPPEPQPTDTQMLDEFHGHRGELDELAVMAAQDRQLSRISATWYRDAHGDNHEAPIAGLLDRARWDDYLRLIRILRLDTGVTIDRDGIFFQRHSEGLMMHGSIKGFALLPAPIHDDLCASLERIPRDSERDGACYRHLEGNWYLFLEWTGI